MRPPDSVERVLVTGADGFVGLRLTSALSEFRPEWEVCALGGPGSPAGVDVSDEEALRLAIGRARPSIVVHLAAVAAVASSVRDPRLTWRVNFGGVLNVVQVLKDVAPDAHLLFVSSAEVYGRSLNDGAPIDEGGLLQPVNPYAAAKAAADILVRQEAVSGLSATVARPFNHTGVGQSDAFVCPSFAGQIARIEAGLQPAVMMVGSLDEERDFLDVADVVEAYLLMLERRRDLAAGEVFNIASGQPVRIGDILERFLSLATVRVDVRTDPDRLRPSPIRRVVGDASRLRGLGWSPRTALDDTLRAMLDDKRARLRGQP